jgi:hypothetical protein
MSCAREMVYTCRPNARSVSRCTQLGSPRKGKHRPPRHSNQQKYKQVTAIVQTTPPEREVGPPLDKSNHHPDTSFRLPP